MRRIIGGLRYDTDTATEVAEASDGYASDFNHYAETLYRAPGGRWFLAGCGGPLSAWATSDCHGTHGGEGIRPVDDDAARRWLERHDEVDAIEEHFAANIKDA